MKPTGISKEMCVLRGPEVIILARNSAGLGRRQRQAGRNEGDFHRRDWGRIPQERTEAKMWGEEAGLQEPGGGSWGLERLHF